MSDEQIKQASYEKLKERVDKIVKRLESDDISLEESTSLYIEGKKIIATISSQLDEKIKTVKDLIEK